jgi:hypothetical protein
LRRSFLKADVVAVLQVGGGVLTHQTLSF